MKTETPGSDQAKNNFEIAEFLSRTGLAQKVVRLKPKEVLFSQGSPADFLFFLQSGRVKITVVSPEGKEATITILSAGEFVGEEALVSVGGLHMSTAIAVKDAVAFRIRREAMIRMMHEDPAFSDRFMRFLLTKSMRTQADLVDQLFNSSEKRLARILLLMAEFGEAGEKGPVIPSVTQETLAEMVGTTRSRVSFFMNRFRKMGLIEYNGGIRVHKSLLNVLLHDQFSDSRAEAPPE